MDSYLGFTKDTDLDKARATFTARFGHEPEEVKDAGTCWLVGPVEQLTRHNTEHGCKPALDQPPAAQLSLF